MADEAILVTGGSRGIGRAVVEVLVRAGERVAFTYRDQEAAARDLEATCGQHARAFRLDLDDAETVGDSVRRIESEMGPLAGLVNNAGIKADGLLAMTSDADWERSLRVNLGGVFRCCREVLPGMVHRRSGSIVNITSIAAVRGVAGQGAYGAAKAGIIALTRTLAREVGRRGIRVNAVAPGFVETDMTAGLSKAEVDTLRATECLPGGVNPVSVAETVRFLLSPLADSITGQCIAVDAGASV
ncbi:MAG: SDR family oxidoreductase [Acidobacteriota bacterium]|nr:SDR family oxidoreductase [Acidobacteriota bacterium]